MDGKTFIVTGATSGIGAATAEMAAAQGARVLLVGRRSDRGQEVVDRIVSAGGTAQFLQGDMTREADIKAMIATVLDQWGQLDFAFNNAGTYSREAAFHEHDEATWDSWLLLNLTGVYRCMKHELAAMLQNANKPDGGCVIVNNASVMGHRGTAYAGPAYAASKHGVIGLTRQAAISYARQGIRVNAVSPGPTETEITAGTQQLPPEARQKVIDDLLPIGRMGKAEEVASAVLYLCSPGAAMITGHDIPLDGGQLAKL